MACYKQTFIKTPRAQVESARMVVSIWATPPPVVVTRPPRMSTVVVEVLQHVVSTPITRMSQDEYQDHVFATFGW